MGQVDVESGCPLFLAGIHSARGLLFLCSALALLWQPSSTLKYLFSLPTCRPFGIPAVEPMLRPCQAVSYCDLIYLGPHTPGLVPVWQSGWVSSAYSLPHAPFPWARGFSMSQTLDYTGAPEPRVTWTAGQIARQSL